MARGIDRPIRWSRPKVADLKASSDIAERGLTCRTLGRKEVVEKVSAA
jgi:hypothetical protein